MKDVITKKTYLVTEVQKESKLLILEGLDNHLEYLRSRSIQKSLAQKMPSHDLKIAQNSHKSVEEFRSLLKFSKYEQQQLLDSIAKLEKQVWSGPNSEYEAKFHKWNDTIDKKSLLNDRTKLKARIMELYQLTTKYHKDVLDREKEVKILGKSLPLLHS